MVTDAAQLYSEVFSPEYFVLICTLALLAYEWPTSDGRTDARQAASGLAARLLTVVVGWVVAFAIYESTELFFDTVPSWGPDFTGSIGLGVGVLVIGGVWRVRDWGGHVPAFATLLFALTVAHTAITPFWDVSSHVAYAVAPAGYLVAADRRFAPLFAVAVGMVAARPLAGAHTWTQSVGGFVLAAAFLSGLRYWSDYRERSGLAGAGPVRER